MAKHDNKKLFSNNNNIGSSLWITAMAENQRFTTEIDITHLTNISTWIQLYTEVRKKSDVVFLEKSLGLARFEPWSSCIAAGCANDYAMPHPCPVSSLSVYLCRTHHEIPSSVIHVCFKDLQFQRTTNVLLWIVF